MEGMGDKSCVLHIALLYERAFVQYHLCWQDDCTQGPALYFCYAPEYRPNYGSTAVNNGFFLFLFLFFVYGENFFIFVCGYLIILITQLAQNKLYVTRQVKE